MTKTPIDKNVEYKGRLMGMAALKGGWTPEMVAEYDYLNACWGKLLPSAGTFTGTPNPARERQIGECIDAGVYRSLYNLEKHGTEGDAIFAEMQARITGAKVMKDPVVRTALEKLLRIGETYLGMSVKEQLGGTTIELLSIPSKCLHPGNLYEDKEPLFPTGNNAAAA